MGATFLPFPHQASADLWWGVRPLSRRRCGSPYPDTPNPDISGPPSRVPPCMTQQAHTCTSRCTRDYCIPRSPWEQLLGQTTSGICRAAVPFDTCSRRSPFQRSQAETRFDLPFTTAGLSPLSIDTRVPTSPQSSPITCLHSSVFSDLTSHSIPRTANEAGELYGCGGLPSPWRCRPRPAEA